VRYGAIVLEDLTAIRIAENQSRFREANEEIEAAADRMHLRGRVPFLCECPRSECTDLVRLTLEEYEEVREFPRYFLTVPGHQDVAVDRGAAVVVAEEDGRYVTVEKIGLAGEIARSRYDDLSR
jgi:hypothetical protein